MWKVFWRGRRAAEWRFLNDYASFKEANQAVESIISDLADTKMIGFRIEGCRLDEFNTRKKRA